MKITCGDCGSEMKLEKKYIAQPKERWICPECEYFIYIWENET